ncbi:unnamed protein product [Heterobilharzia americana]|nr:unnamed protein product [Heterobilharzia americana]
MQECLEVHDFRTFSALQPKLIKVVDEMLSTEVAKLVQMIPQEREAIVETYGPAVTGGAFDTSGTPFSFHAGEGFEEGRFENDWIVNRCRQQWDEDFLKLNPVDGKISGEAARSHMLKSNLPNSTLRNIWILGDVDRDGCLDEDEFSLVCYLIKLKLEGYELPSCLPEHLIPPSKRNVGQPLRNGYHKG